MSNKPKLLSKLDINYDFQHAYNDGWNNYEFCGCCEQPFKTDGMIRHLIGKSKTDPEHRRWLEEHVDKSIDFK